MSSFPNSPRLVKGGIALIDPDTLVVKKVIELQYNPDTLTRTLQVRSFGAEGGDRLEALRFKGPPMETITLEAEVDATDRLEFPNKNPNTQNYGIHPQLAALEALVYPTVQQLTDGNDSAKAGRLEIAPPEAPLTLFLWSDSRHVPVRFTEFTISEEAFDTSLNPIRAKVTLGMQVVSIYDVGFNHPAGQQFMTYLRQKEQLADKSRAG